MRKQSVLLMVRKRHHRHDRLNHTDMRSLMAITTGLASQPQVKGTGGMLTVVHRQWRRYRIVAAVSGTFGQDYTAD